MKLKTMILSSAALAVSATMALADWPERPVTLLTPWPPGDVEDTIARLIADRMEAEFDVPVQALNRPGGGGVIGATEVANAPANGYMIGNLVIDLVTSHVALGNTTYPIDAFETVGIYVTYPFILAASADAPYDNLAELADYAKTNEISLGHFGYGAIPTKVTFDVADQLGFSFASEASFEALDCTTLSNGDADVINTTTQQVQACLDSGAVKAIASYTNDRIVTLPDTLTLHEQVDGDPIVLWGGLFVPKGTPQEVIDKIAAVAAEVMASEEVDKIRQATGAELYWQGPKEGKARLDKDYKAGVDLLKKLGEL
ncbi:tripartite tricarboxylate transporter substrate binding protein [Mameliella alba]|nr:tripartite tricarboxylate transporter substrate binding protein [Antarctobacter heliothermus]MBY6145820.1 tripartite tricarboxylate transporter substrate binding protein [Mameliella alba]MCA0954763.1 tripartite tricarboxylate transporter substrate binding protein [Mameliella alba]